MANQTLHSAMRSNNDGDNANRNKCGGGANDNIDDDTAGLVDQQRRPSEAQAVTTSPSIAFTDFNKLLATDNHQGEEPEVTAVTRPSIEENCRHNIAGATGVGDHDEQGENELMIVVCRNPGLTDETQSSDLQPNHRSAQQEVTRDDHDDVEGFSCASLDPPTSDVALLTMDDVWKVFRTFLHVLEDRNVESLTSEERKELECTTFLILQAQLSRPDPENTSLTCQLHILINLMFNGGETSRFCQGNQELQKCVFVCMTLLDPSVSSRVAQTLRSLPVPNRNNIRWSAPNYSTFLAEFCEACSLDPPLPMNTHDARDQLIKLLAEIAIEESHTPALEQKARTATMWVADVRYQLATGKISENEAKSQAARCIKLPENDFAEKDLGSLLFVVENRIFGLRRILLGLKGPADAGVLVHGREAEKATLKRILNDLPFKVSVEALAEEAKPHSLSRIENEDTSGNELSRAQDEDLSENIDLMRRLRDSEKRNDQLLITNAKLVEKIGEHKIVETELRDHIEFLKRSRVSLLSRVKEIESEKEKLESENMDLHKTIQAMKQNPPQPIDEQRAQPMEGNKTPRVPPAWNGRKLVGHSMKKPAVKVKPKTST